MGDKFLGSCSCWGESRALDGCGGVTGEMEWMGTLCKAVGDESGMGGSVGVEEAACFDESGMLRPSPSRASSPRQPLEASKRHMPVLRSSALRGMRLKVRKSSP